MSPLHVAVIGAGPSGLVAAKSLFQNGFSVTCFEAGERVGGQWVIDNSSGTSCAYRSLRTNTSKAMSRYSDFELPAHYPEYPGHAQMAAWFESYARHFGVLERVRFGTRVMNVAPRDGGRFAVHTASGDAGEYDAVVVANGNLWDPIEPTFSGRFAGPQLHAKHYRDPGTPVDLRGKRVLVTGLGNSGCEIAVELAAANGPGKTLVSARSGQLILRRPDGAAPAPPHPTDPVPMPLRILPKWARDRLFPFIFRRVVRRAFGGTGLTPQDVGLPPPPDNLRSKRAVVNDDILRLIKSGDIAAKPNVARLMDDAVQFTDGSTEAIDAIVHATGYRFSLPFLSPQTLGVGDPHDLRLYRGVMHPEHHNLFVVGVMRALCCIWPRSEQQALWIAARLRGAVRLPSAERIRHAAYPVLKVPFDHCQFHAHDLRRDYAR